MSSSYLQHLTPGFKSGSSDNYFLWNDTDPYKGADTSIGYDVDKAKISIGGKQYGDYDEFVKPHLSSGESVIPRQLNQGKQTYSHRDSADGGKVYNMTDMLGLNPDATMGEMIVVGNGRVGDIDRTESGKFLPNTDLTMVHDNKETAIKGILDENAVTSIFFSDMNMKVLQDAMRYGVYQKTQKIIGEQSKNELYIIMRSIMLQYANFQSSADSVLEEVRRLNGKVLIYCIDSVSSNVSQQLKYLEELKTLPTPIDRPAYVEHPRNLTYDMSNLL